MHDLPAPPADLLRDASLFLDFDGTLVEIAATPDAVVVPDALPALLSRLGTMLAGRVAIVSGRPAGEIRGHIGAEALVVGSHGLEFDRPGVAIDAPPRGRGLDAALAEAQAFAVSRDGVLIEDKPFGVGLHYRGAPGCADAVAALGARLADAHDLVLQPGKMVVELRLGGHDKGSAVARLMAEPAWSPTRPVVMGDDVTDEAAFAAASERGGAGILIGPMRDTAARYRLDGVAQALAWLEAAV